MFVGVRNATSRVDTNNAGPGRPVLAGIAMGVVVCLVCQVTTGARQQFTGPFKSWVNLKTRYGAKGDGEADDTTAIQRALNDLAKHHGVLYIPAGTYRVTKTLRLVNVARSAIVGKDPAKTTILWDGPTGQPLLYTNIVHESRFERITWDGNGKAGALIHHDVKFIDKETSWWIQHIDEQFRNAEVGVRAGEVSYQVSEVSLLRCSFQSLSKAGVRIGSHNSLNYWLRHCVFDDCYEGVTVATFGNYYVRECLFRNSRRADMAINGSCTFGIRQNVSIGSKAFLIVQGNGAVWSHLTIQDNRVVSAAPAGPLLSLNCRGPVCLIDNRFESPKSPVIKGSGPNTVAIGNKYCAPGEPISIGGQVLTMDEERVAESFNIAAPELPSAPPSKTRWVIQVTPGASASTIQRAINTAVKKSPRPAVYLPQGTYQLDRTLVIPARTDLEILGDGMGTQLKGGGNGPIIGILGPSHVTLQNLHLANGREGVVVRGCDQKGARIYFERCSLMNSRQAAFVVSRLRNAQVVQSMCETAFSAGPAVKVIGPPEPSSKPGVTTTRSADTPPTTTSSTTGPAAGKAARVYLLQSLFLNSTPMFEVVNGGCLLVRDGWAESPKCPYLRVAGSGQFAAQAMMWAINAGAGEGPMSVIEDFAGDISICNLIMLGKTQPEVVLRGNNKDMNVLLMSTTGTHSNFFKNDSHDPRAALIRCAGAFPHCAMIADHGWPDNPDDQWLLKMLEQVRTNPAPPDQANPKVSDVRLYGVYFEGFSTAIRLRR